MVGALSGFKIGKHSRRNAGTTADNSVVVANKPGWLHGVQAFNVSSATLQFLLIYDSSAAVSSATSTGLLIWEGVIPFYGSLSTGSLTDIAGGAGFTWDNAGPIPFDNGLTYSLSGSIDPTTPSTMAANLSIINMQFQTSTVG